MYIIANEIKTISFVSFILQYLKKWLNKKTFIYDWNKWVNPTNILSTNRLNWPINKF